MHTYRFAQESVVSACTIRYVILVQTQWKSCSGRTGSLPLSRSVPGSPTLPAQLLPVGHALADAALVPVAGRLVEGLALIRRRVPLRHVVGTGESVVGVRVVLVAGSVAEVLHQARGRVEDVRGDRKSVV